jgi:hypothetical protein
VIVTGHWRIDRGLRRLERKVGRKIVMKGLRAGAKVSAKAVKAGAPKGETKLLARIQPVQRVGRAGGKRRNLQRNTIGLNVHYTARRFQAAKPNLGQTGQRPTRWRSRKSKPRTTAFYPLVVEFGEPSQGRAPNPFIRRGHQRSRGQAMAAAKRTILAEIKAELRKLGKG